MTIQEAINKAIAGGYPKERLVELAVPVQAHGFRETAFWEALVRALGVEGDFEYIQRSRDAPRKMRQPLWLYYWHRFQSHLVAGNTPNRSSRRFPTPQELHNDARDEPLCWSDHSMREVPSQRYL